MTRTARLLGCAWRLPMATPYYDYLLLAPHDARRTEHFLDVSGAEHAVHGSGSGSGQQGFGFGLGLGFGFGLGVGAMGPCRDACPSQRGPGGIA